jgi:hypothetical protein
MSGRSYTRAQAELPLVDQRGTLGSRFSGVAGQTPPQRSPRASGPCGGLRSTRSTPCSKSVWSCLARGEQDGPAISAGAPSRAVAARRRE